jgi:hypothetical protein
MVFWGNTPPGSLASFYFPAVSSGDILALADSLYAFHQLTAADANTIQCPTESNGVTFIPLPTSTVRYAGLLTVNLPPGITFGDQYDIVIRQTTIKSATITPPPPTPPPPPIPQVIPASQHPHSETAKTLSTITAPQTFTWRQVLGIFQVSIPITKKGQLLLPEERLLSWLLWKLTVVPTTSRWYPVLQRYLGQVSGRVTGFGGDPSKIPPSSTGTLTPLPGPGHHHHKNFFTGKVAGIKFDRFGDFEGFLLRLADGEEKHFRAHGLKVLQLVGDAMREARLLSVRVEKHHHEVPVEYILH